MKVTLHIWRQSKPSTKDDFAQDGKMVRYELDTVSLGYEFWRQLNAFPPSLRNQSEEVKPAGKDEKPQASDEK